MQSRQKQVIEMIQRVQDFLGANPPPPSTGYTLQKKNLDDVVATLTEHSTDQVSGRKLSRAETQRQKALRRKLRVEHIGPIAQIARASLADVPGIENALRLPPDNLSTMKLVAEANSMRETAAKFEPLFVESGRPEDFLKQLDAAIEELRQSVLGRARNVGQHVGAKAGIAKEIKRGRKTVELLDTVVRAAFRQSPDVLAKWRIARRIRVLPTGGGAGPTGTGGTADENTPDIAPAAA